MASDTALSKTQILAQGRSGRTLWAGLSMLLLIVLLAGGYTLSGQPVTLLINGQSYQVRTHFQTVENLVQGMGLTLEAEDIVQPQLSSSLSSGDVITIRLARPVTVQADGRSWSLLTHHRNIADVLAQINLTLNPRDEIFVHGKQVSRRSPLPEAQPRLANDSVNRLWTATAPRAAIRSSRPKIVRLIIRRAVPLTLIDEQAVSRFYSARATVRQALLEQGLSLFPEDNVTPSLDTRLSPGIRIFIERSTPVKVTVDGQVIEARTHQETAAGVLAELGIALVGQDYSLPPANYVVAPDDTIEIIRVRETLEIDQEFIPFETKWVPDEELQLDQQLVLQQGGTGVIKARTRVRYENGQEIWRELEDRWLDREPSNRVIAYGTKIIVRTLETETGPIEYWRKIPMLTTAYSAATSGKAPDHPRYGITRTGLEAGHGIVAVDPKVIPLMSKVFVPGYGHALAADTGGAVLGKHIDLGYDQNPPLMYEWRDVYILTPVPPAERIRYVLPQWPQRP